MEPETADHLYTEKLVRLPNLSVHYTPPIYPAYSLRRQDLGVRESAVVFLCAQSLYKYLPQFDIVFPRIAQQLPNSQFLFFSSQHSSELTEKFRRRIARAFEAEGVDPAAHLVILPRGDNSTFQAIARLSDIYLDSIEWSGCNTTLESMACGLPAITCKGAAMRGRHTYAFLTMMGLNELIANDVSSYINLAVRLGRDRDWRNGIRAELSARLPRILGDVACVRALEEFLWRGRNHAVE
jgi:protein O-GlcNAc transferase